MDCMRNHVIGGSLRVLLEIGKKAYFFMRHSTLTADFKTVYLNIYIQLIYVIIIGV